MKCRRLAGCVLLALLVSLVVGACGGSHTRTVTHTTTTVTTQTSTTTATTTAVVGPPTNHLKCSPGDTTMQCVLARQPPPNAGSLPKGTPSTYGVDFGWRSMSAAGAKHLGAKFGASYLSTDASKNWTRALVDQYHNAGLKTVAVWETSANRAQGTQTDGANDARAARTQAAALGMPANRVIEFAVDCNCSTGSISAYFRGVKSVLGVSHEGVYGGYDQVMGLHGAGLVGGENWQTYAWSGGRWAPASIAPLEQYLNGSSFDNDRAIAPLYGQWPAVAPAPKVSLHYSWMPNTRRTFKVTSKGKTHTVKTRERLVLQYMDHHGCNPSKKTGRFSRRGCVEHAVNDRLLRDRIDNLAHHNPGRTHTVKKPRWNAPHYKAAGPPKHVTTLGGARRQLQRRVTYHAHPYKQW